MTKAVRIYYDMINDVEQIEIDDHNIEFSGMGSGGYCYSHQTFDCIDSLTDEQWKAIENYE